MANMMEVLEKYNKRIKLNNEKFYNMSKAEKGVQIAKDVLEQIRLKKLIPKNMIYFRSYIKEDTVFETTDDQKLIGSLEQCEVCAIGAVFAATVLRTNKSNNTLEYSYETISETSKDTLMNYLGKYFSDTQLLLMEEYFEYEEDRCSCVDCLESSSPLSAKDKFVSKYDTAVSRLTAIMKNIIKNNGTFVP